MLKVSKDLEVEQIADYPPNNRFIKLPVNNYLGLLNIVPNRPQNAIINAVNDPRYRFVTACVSRRVGKTFISNIVGQLVLLHPGTTVLIIAPDYSLASISWDLQRELLDSFDIERKKDNAKDRIIQLENGSMIKIASVGKVDSAVGRSYDLIIFDEAALNNDGERAFNISLRPTLDKVNSKCIFISTPRGDNWFKAFFDRGFNSEYPDWISIHADYHENPRVSEEDIAAAKRDMSVAEFEQEYLANFVTFEGQVWDLRSEQIIEVDISERNRYEFICGIDVGFRDYTAFCVIAIRFVDDKPVYYIVDEYFNRQADTSVHASALAQLDSLYDLDAIFIDSAAAQMRHDFASLYDISTMNAKKDLLAGIGFVARVVDSGRLFVDENCVECIFALRNYRWSQNTAEKPEHDRASHMADAIRYAIYTYGLVLEG